MPSTPFKQVSGHRGSSAASPSATLARCLMLLCGIEAMRELEQMSYLPLLLSFEARVYVVCMMAICGELLRRAACLIEQCIFYVCIDLVYAYCQRSKLLLCDIGASNTFEYAMHFLFPRLIHRERNTYFWQWRKVEQGCRARVELLALVVSAPSCFPAPSDRIGTTMIADVLAWACLVWYLFILTVCSIGVFQMYPMLHSFKTWTCADETVDCGISLQSLHRPYLHTYPLKMSLMSPSFALSRISSLTFTLVSPRLFSKNTPAKS